MEQKPTAAVVLSVLAGVAMFGTGGMMFRMGTSFTGWNSWMWGQGMMRMMMPAGVWSPWFGAAGGGIIIVASLLLYNEPRQSRTWGVVILLVSLLNLLVGMGGVLAAGLGIAGGALAMSWPSPPSGH